MISKQQALDQAHWRYGFWVGTCVILVGYLVFTTAGRGVWQPTWGEWILFLLGAMAAWALVIMLTIFEAPMWVGDLADVIGWVLLGIFGTLAALVALLAFKVRGLPDLAPSLITPKGT